MLILSACGPNYLYNESSSFEQDTWSYAQIQQHEVEIEDLSHLYNLSIGVKHSVEYAYQNLYVKITTTFPDQQTREQVLSLDLADGSGTWYGKCGGKNCTLTIPIQQNAIFEKAGRYRLSIEQYMRTEKVEGIRSLSFMVEKTQNVANGQGSQQ